jgi:hypothetical protein
MPYQPKLGTLTIYKEEVAMKIKVTKLIKAFIPYGLIVLYRHYRTEHGFTWVMTKNEQKLFKLYIRNAKTYLEFGSGGSTITALTHSGRKVYSVESSLDWINTMKQKYKIIGRSEKSGQLNLIHADIGKTADWGIPVILDDENNTDRFLNYTQRIFEKYPETKLADAILIDGRFRVACCLSSLLETNETTIILIHDFWDRDQYHIIKKFVIIIDRIDSLMVCKKKPAVSDIEIRNEFDNYKNDYA